MSLNDPLANALSHIINSEKCAKDIAFVKPSSKILLRMLEIMKDEGFIGEFKEIKNGKGDIIEVNLLCKINDCGVIKPRSSLKKGEFEKYEKRYLPARDFGVLIMSTTKGIVTHNEAKKQGLGGKLIAYCY